MVCIELELVRYQPQQPFFNLAYILARRDTGAVGYPENVGVHGNGGLPEGGVEHHVGCLASDTGQCLQCGPVLWNLAVVLLCKYAAGLDDVTGLGVEEANGFYVFLESGFSESEHGSGCRYFFEQAFGGLVNTDVG